MYASRPSRRTNVSITAFMYPLWRYSSSSRMTSRRNSSSLKKRFSPRPSRRIGKARANQLELDVPIADRKSTRLNSSHSQISYAVFCLKKNILHDRDTRLEDVGDRAGVIHHHRLGRVLLGELDEQAAVTVHDVVLDDSRYPHVAARRLV